MRSSIVIVILVFVVLGILLGFSEAFGQPESYAVQLDNNAFKPVFQSES